MCGVSTTFGQRASPWSLLRGSGVITSRPAPPIIPSCRAKRVLAFKGVWCSPRGLRPKPPDQRVLPWKCWLCRWWAASWTKGSGKRCPLSLGSDLHTFDQDALEWDEHWTHNSWQPNSTKREAIQRIKQQKHLHNHSGIQAHTTKNTFQQLNTETKQGSSTHTNKTSDSAASSSNVTCWAPTFVWLWLDFYDLENGILWTDIFWKPCVPLSGIFILATIPGEPEQLGCDWSRSVLRFQRVKVWQQNEFKTRAYRVFFLTVPRHFQTWLKKNLLS